MTTDVNGEEVLPLSHSVRANIVKYSKISLEVLSATAATAFLSAASPNQALARERTSWNKIDLPVRETLFDITFDESKPEHGWIVGAKGTFLETFDGGNSWKPRAFTSLDEDVSFIFLNFYRVTCMCRKK